VNRRPACPEVYVILACLLGVILACGIGAPDVETLSAALPARQGASTPPEPPSMTLSAIGEADRLTTTSVLPPRGLFTEIPRYGLGLEIHENLNQLLDTIAQADTFAVISFCNGPGRAEFGVCCLEDAGANPGYVSGK
jgi:hypothetical protein